MATIRIIYASTSGHTEFVVDTLTPLLESGGHSVTTTKAEKATSDDLMNCDMLILASGTWNTGGTEGQLNPHMHALLFEKVQNISLAKTSIALISLGDERYYFTTRCTEHFIRFLKSAGGRQLLPPLLIVNEPFDQVPRITAWAAKINAALAS